MQQQDEQKFAELMSVLTEVFDDGRPPSKLKMEVYYKALVQFDILSIEKAVKGLIFTRTTASFPKPAEIIQEIQGTASNRATLAWIKVIEAVRRIGNYESVQFDDPIIHSVFKFWGGWSVTVNDDWDESKLKWKQAEFEKLYATMSQDNSHPKYLPGKCEIDNAARGFDIKPEIIKIGFEIKAGQKQITSKTEPGG